MNNFQNKEELFKYLKNKKVERFKEKQEREKSQKKQEREKLLSMKKIKKFTIDFIKMVKKDSKEIKKILKLSNADLEKLYNKDFYIYFNELDYYLSFESESSSSVLMKINILIYPKNYIDGFIKSDKNNLNKKIFSINDIVLCNLEFDYDNNINFYKFCSTTYDEFRDWYDARVNAEFIGTKNKELKEKIFADLRDGKYYFCKV